MKPRLRKPYQNGKFTEIKYPGAVQTQAMAINDSGEVVGQYVNGNLENAPKGFSFKNGVYTTVKAKNSSAPPTFIYDINNAGAMVADFSLLIGGVSKSVPVPGAYEVHLNGINDLDEVTGDAVYQSGSNYVWRGFTATCK